MKTAILIHPPEGEKTSCYREEVPILEDISVEAILEGLGAQALVPRVQESDNAPAAEFDYSAKKTNGSLKAGVTYLVLK